MSGDVLDPVANPYAPGAGTPPPALVGRDQVIDAAQVSLQRLAAGRSTQHQMLTGLRGVGKTVLLRHLASIAESLDFRVIRQEAVGDDDTVVSLLRQCRSILDELDPTPRVQRALRAIDSVALTVAGTGLRIERDDRPPDREALTDVIVDVAAAAAEAGRGIVIALDEAQLLPDGDLRRIVAGVHRCGQDALPLWCVLAGLPNLIGIAAKAATYTERLFTGVELGPLSGDQVITAVTAPAEELGVAWDREAAEAVADRSDGYPFFVQMWAYHTWNAARQTPISPTDVDRAAAAALLNLDSSFFAARIARVPESEVAYVRALATLGAGPHRSKDVAAVMGRASSQVSGARDRLIRDGVVFSPRFGWIEFSFPHFDDYIRRTFPD
jgi:hypothetical protein